MIKVKANVAPPIGIRWKLKDEHMLDAKLQDSDNNIQYTFTVRLDNTTLLNNLLIRRSLSTTKKEFRLFHARFQLMYRRW